MKMRESDNKGKKKSWLENSEKEKKKKKDYLN